MQKINMIYTERPIGMYCIFFLHICRSKWPLDQCCQPVQIICICPDICAFSVLDNRHCADMCTIYQKCQFKVKKGWQLGKLKHCHCSLFRPTPELLNFIKSGQPHQRYQANVKTKKEERERLEREWRLRKIQVTETWETAQGSAKNEELQKKAEDWSNAWFSYIDGVAGIMPIFTY